MVQLEQGDIVKSLQARLSRRHFVLAAATATVAGAAAMTVRNQKASPSSERPGTSHKAAYQVTEHIRNYYRTTRI